MALLNNLNQKPLYKQVEDIIVRKITNQEYLPGAKIPSSRQLAERYGINRLTVTKAVNQLAKSGLLYKKPSSGTYINKNLKRNTAALNLNFSNSGLMAILQKQGTNLRTKVVNKAIFNNIPYFAQKLNLKLDEKIFAVHRLRLIQNKPIALEYNYLPLKYFPDVNQINFNHVGLYDYMRSKKHNVCHNNDRLIVIPAAKKEANLMMIKPGTLLYKAQYITSDADYNIVEFTESFLLPQELCLHYQINY